MEASSTSVAEPASSNEAQRELARWQRRLLPFMTWGVALIGIAFVSLSAFDLATLRSSVYNEPSSNLQGQVEQHFNEQKAGLSTPDQVFQQTLVMLEAAAIEKRYHQANALNMSRILTKHLSFVTGAILALLGAVFILGKLSEIPSQAAAGTSQWRFSFTSASPGIILAFLGTAVVVVSLLVQNTITVEDHAIYVYSVVATPQMSQTSPVIPKPPDVLHSSTKK